MSTHEKAACVMVYVITLLLGGVYVKHQIATLTVKGTTLHNVGVMEFKDGDRLLYVPIFTKEKR
jgi:hypothetical protein